MTFPELQRAGSNTCWSGKGGYQRQRRSSQETMVQPRSGALVPTQGIHTAVFFLGMKTTPKWKMLTTWLGIVHHWELECKSWKLRDIWSNRQIWPWCTKAGHKLTESCQENILVTANTLFQHHKRHSTHGHHQMVNNEIRLIILFAAEDTEILYSQQKKKKKRLGTNCGLDQ